MKRMQSLLCFLLVLGLHAQDGTITKGLKTFSEVKVFDGLSVKLIRSTENKAIITGANTNKVAIVNNGGVLKLRMEIDKIFSGYRTFVELYYSAELKVLDTNEDARLYSDNVFEQDVMELKAQEGGEMEINCQVEQLLIKSVTGGEITTKGFSKNQDVILNTGGIYDGKEFKTEFTTIAVNAGGKGKIYATEYVKATVKAGGQVEVYGDPLKMDEKKVFGGKINRM